MRLARQYASARVRVHWGGALSACASTLYVDGGINGQQMGRSESGKLKSPSV